MILTHRKFSILIFAGSLLVVLVFLPHPAAAAGRINFTRASNSIGLIGHWTFDGRQMIPNVRDSSTQGNHGNLSGQAATTTVPGIHGQALQFDGGDDIVSTGSDSIGTTALTITAWARATTTGEGGVGRIVDNGSAIFRINNGSNQIAFSSDGATTNAVSASAVVTLGRWMHVVATRDSSGVANIYINGVLTGSANQTSGTPVAGTSNVIVGNNSAGSATFGGDLDDVRIHNRVLSADEIAKLYRTGRPAVTLGKPPINVVPTLNRDLATGTVAYYTFDGVRMIPNVRDSSGQGNHAEIVGQTSTTTGPGMVGQSLYLGGVNDYVRASSTSLNLTGGAITISAWVNMTSSGAEQVIVGKPVDDDSHTSPYFSYSIHFLHSASPTKSYRFLLSLGGVETSVATASGAAVFNRWQHVTGVYDGSTMKIYLDGVLNNTTSGLSGNITSYGTPLRLGANGALQEDYIGYMDDVHIWNRALSATEVLDNYNLRRRPAVVAKTPLGPNLNSGLVGWWTMDGPKMIPNVRDSSTQGNHGNLSGQAATTTVPGIHGQALNFDGVDDYVSIGDSDNLDFVNNFSLSLWMNTRSDTATTQWRTALIKGWTASCSNPRNYSIYLNYDEVYISWYNSVSGFSSFATTNANLVEGRWYHVTYVRDSAREYIYVDGILLAEQAIAVAMETNANELRLGECNSDSGGLGEIWNGYLDDVRIYTRALSAEEVLTLYKLGR